MPRRQGRFLPTSTSGSPSALPTWHLFHGRYVTTGAFDESLHSLATNAQQTRERGDYEAIAPSSEEAKKIVEGASEFVAAVERMLGV